MDDALLEGIAWFFREFEGRSLERDAETIEMPDAWDWDEEKMTVTVTLPIGDSEYTFGRDEFLQVAAECQQLTFAASAGLLKTPCRVLQVVTPLTEKASRCSTRLCLPITTEGIRCCFLPPSFSFILGFGAYKADAYEEDFHAPDGYPAVEIFFEKPEKQQDAENFNLIEAALFEFAAQGYAFSKAPLQAFDFDDDDTRDSVPSFRPLEAFNEGIHLFNSAISIQEPELRFLSLYKVIEYFGPVVIRLKRNEALRKKLDSPQAMNPDANFLDSIFQLSLAMNERGRDAELPKFVLSECIDFVELSSLLPPSIKRPLTYGSKRAEIDSLISSVAESLYATRNRVAHAKSNYAPQSGEFVGGELQQINNFLEVGCIQVVRWYNRLPKHLRLLFA